MRLWRIRPDSVAAEAQQGRRLCEPAAVAAVEGTERGGGSGGGAVRRWLRWQEPAGFGGGAGVGGEATSGGLHAECSG